VIEGSELRELAAFVSKGAPALSLYLDTDLTQQPKEKCKLVLRDLLQQVEESASETDRARVERFFALEYDWQARGIALFSAAGEDLWRIYPLPIPVDSMVHTGDGLYLAPLTEFMAERERYGVVLVDRESARFLLTQLGQIEEREEWVGEELKRHKQGGFAASRFQRHEDNLADRNLKLAAEATGRFCRQTQCIGLILGGSDETVSMFRDRLPKALQKQVLGTLALEMAAPITQIAERSAELVQRKGQERKRDLVDRLVTAAAKGGDAVIGLADTFYMVHQGRAHTLVLERGFDAVGYQCTECNYVSPEPIEKCPFCGGIPRKIRGAVNWSIRRALADGGTVETVSDSPALRKAGRIGAILRY
jgi:peptide chain release factor subunit 1